jgi:hypothetical protein
MELEEPKDLVEHLAMLARRAEDRFDVGPAAQLDDQRRQLDRLGARAENDERLQDVERSSRKPATARMPSDGFIVVSASTRERCCK